MNQYTWKNYSDKKKQYGCPHCGCKQYSTEVNSGNYSESSDTTCYCYGCGREFDAKEICYV